MQAVNTVTCTGNSGGAAGTKRSQEARRDAGVSRDESEAGVTSGSGGGECAMVRGGPFIAFRALSETEEQLPCESMPAGGW